LIGPEANTGLVVAHVEEKGPAAQAGIQVHDLLLRLNEEPLRSEVHLRALLRRFKAGRPIRLALLRAGKPQTATVKVADVPVEAEGPQVVPAHAAGGAGFHVTSVVTTRGVGQAATTLSKRSWSDGEHTLRLTERGGPACSVVTKSLPAQGARWAILLVASPAPAWGARGVVLGRPNGRMTAPAPPGASNETAGKEARPCNREPSW